MPTITIHDLRHGSLAFDLSDLLQIAGKAALESTWRCAVTECMSHGGAAADHALHDAYHAATELPGTNLFELAADTRQVIDGTFSANHPERGEWLRLKAIDSSFWEVEASRDAYLEPFENHFHDVRRLGVS